MPEFNPSDFLILVVDDLSQNLKIMGSILDRQGYRVTIAQSGVQAIDRVQKSHPDLILLDLMMPEMDGLQVCHYLKSTPEFETIPILFLTASKDKEDILAAFEAGAVDFITKPFIKSEVLARIKTQLQLSRIQQSLQTQNIQLEKFSHNLKTLHRLDTRTYDSVAAIFDDHLATGCQMFGLAMGLITRGERDRTHVIAQKTQNSALALPMDYIMGHLSEISQKTYAVLQQTQPQDIDPLSHQLPFTIATSFSTPIWVNGQLFGTLYFGDGERRGYPFQSHEVDVLELMARGLGKYIAVDQLEQERQKISKRKDELLAIAGHELRTPLTSISAAVRLLATGKLGEFNPKGQQLIDIAATNIDRLIRLINNLLNLERLESGELQMEKKSYTILELVEQAIAAMQPMAQKQEITLNYHEIPTTLKVWVDGDQILQILTNLINNAIKFSPAQSAITIHTEVQDHLVKVLVNDQGRGIAPEQCDRIFERFKQVKTEDQNVYKGTGLGLAICREIIRHHQGSIWAESEVGQGSTFIFTLPQYWD
ncbi:response regulator [Spirulina major CS-329]|uniref:response regulator n=1 Tax=Spirulina sp. TaxID=1157 RepID=UPI00232C8F77|nr:MULTISPECIES: response regulator [Spirulina]MDB9496540.1 response regulator [Spirulina subsalsa CS-330]MDB9503247.1 response regulator [Spirulina major CS-329]